MRTLKLLPLRRDWFVQWLKPCNVEAAHRPVVDGIPQISVQELKRESWMRRKTSSSSTSASRMGAESRISGAPLIPVGDIERRASSWQTRRTAKSSSATELAYAARRPRWPSSRLDSRMFQTLPAAFWLGRKRSIRRCQGPDDNQRRCNSR